MLEVRPRAGFVLLIGSWTRRFRVEGSDLKQGWRSNRGLVREETGIERDRRTTALLETHSYRFQ